jgi:hypothetical protein
MSGLGCPKTLYGSCSQLVVVVPVADISDKPITAETELEDPTDNAVAVSESDGDAYWFYWSFSNISNW